MHVPVGDLAKMLEVHKTTVYRWAKDGGFIDSAGPGRRGEADIQKIPVRAFLNYLVEHNKLPFSRVESLNVQL